MMRLHLIFCGLLLAATLCEYIYFLATINGAKNSEFQLDFFGIGSIFTVLFSFFMYGYIGYLMITLLSPVDERK